MVKKKGHAKKHRRIKNLLEKYKHREPTSNKIKRDIRIFNPLYSTYIPEYKKEQDFWKEEDYIKMFFKALEEDIELYKGLKEKYGDGGGKQVIPQINRHCSELEKKFSGSSLPKEKLEEFGKEYEAIKSKLKEVGFYGELKI